jgi:hypothetical protein
MARVDQHAFGARHSRSSLGTRQLLRRAELAPTDARVTIEDEGDSRRRIGVGPDRRRRNGLLAVVVFGHQLDKLSDDSQFLNFLAVLTERAVLEPPEHSDDVSDVDIDREIARLAKGVELDALHAGHARAHHLQLDDCSVPVARSKRPISDLSDERYHVHDFDPIQRRSAIMRTFNA